MQQPTADMEHAALDDLAVAPELDGTVLLWQAARLSAPRHRHRELELNLVRRGTGSFLVCEKRHSLRPGVMVWLFPGQDHVLVNPSNDLELWIGLFRPSLVERLAGNGTRALLDGGELAGAPSRRVDPTARRRAVSTPC